MKYRILVEGKNVLIKLDGRIQKVGFFTTRFIEADNVLTAKDIAIDLIKDELKNIILNDISTPPILSIDEIKEIESFGDNYNSGVGFSWFPEKDS